MLPRKRYRVFWTASAAADLAAVKEFIERDDPIGAVNLVASIRNKAQTLTTLPHRGRVVEELKSHGLMQYHELPLPPWRIVYRVEAGSVYVLGMFDSRRNLQDILFERFLRH